MGIHERPEVGSPVRTLGPIQFQSPRAVGTEKLVLWEEEQDCREPQVIWWRVVVVT